MAWGIWSSGTAVLEFAHLDLLLGIWMAKTMHSGVWMTVTPPA